MSCGIGGQTRERLCLQPITGEQKCEGDAVDMKKCVEKECIGMSNTICLPCLSEVKGKG